MIEYKIQSNLFPDKHLNFYLPNDMADHFKQEAIDAIKHEVRVDDLILLLGKFITDKEELLTVASMLADHVDFSGLQIESGNPNSSLT